MAVHEQLGSPVPFRQHRPGSWNLGPGPESFVTVGAIADLAASLWSDGAAWEVPAGVHPHEAELLALDATRARTELGWNDRLTYHDAVEWTVAWERDRLGGATARSLCVAQRDRFATASPPAGDR